MFLTEKKSGFPSFSPFRAVAKRSKPNDFDLVSRSFDESILRRLKTLAISPSSPRAISLSWLAMAVDFLSSTHAEAEALVSKLTSDDSTRSFYLDHSVKLLDICNSISSEIERLRHRRLLMNFLLRLLQVSDDAEIPPPDKLRKAKDSIVDWERNCRDLSKQRRSFEIRDPEVLIRDLAAAIVNIAPSRKTSNVGKVVLRTIYAVGLVTVFVAGVAVSALHGLPEIAKIRVPAEFLWADSVNDLQSSIFEGDRKVVVREIDDVATRASGLRDLVDAVLSGENIEVNKERLRNAVKDMETATSRFSEELDRVSDGVNEMFRNILGTRNSVLENFRVGTEEKQRK